MSNDTVAPYPPNTAALTPRTTRLLTYARHVFTIIAVASALTLVVAAILHWRAPEEVNWVVWVRAGFYTVGAAWLVTLVRAARDRQDRSAVRRMQVIGVLAPLGIAALVISPDSGYPFWMKVEQAAFGLILLPVGIGLLRPSVSREFPKHHAAPASTTPARQEPRP